MKFPTVAKNETYVTILVTAFMLLLIFSFLGRVPIDRSNLEFTVFFEGDARIHFYDGTREPSERVLVLVPVESLELNQANLERFAELAEGRFVGNMEFYGNQLFIRKFYERTRHSKILKVHYVKPEELVRYNERTLFKRLWRAVVERSVDVIVLPDDEKTRAAYAELSKFFAISRELKVDDPQWENEIFGVLLGVYVTAQLPLAALIFLLFKRYTLFVSVMGIVGTLACFYSASKQRFLQLANFVVLGGLVNFALYSYPYLNDLDLFRGVKVSLLLLPALSGLKFFADTLVHGRARLRAVTLALGLFAVGAVVLILRSGNYGFVSEFEERLRHWLENVFVVRPRIKELVFLPILFFSASFVSRFWNDLLTFFGTIGLVSVFNSFCHVKSPVFVVAYREVTTILVAAAIYVVMHITKNLVLLWTGRG